MKLWQKVFLLSAVLATLAVFFTSLGVTASWFYGSLEREKESAVQLHAYMISDFSNAAAYRRAVSGKLRLPTQEAQSLIAQTVDSLPTEDAAAGVYFENTRIAGEEMPISSESTFLTHAAQAGQCAVEVRSDGGEDWIYVASYLTVEGSDYLLITRSPVTDLYSQYKTQLWFVRAAGLVAAALVGLALYFAVRSLLRPLDRVNDALCEIADGDYSVRLPDNGGVEFRQLAGNVNEMVQSVEENVDRLSRIAESRKRFSDSLAHEMKTPLTSVMGLADVMRISKTMSDQERVEYANIIVHETRRLQNLSSKLLELAGAENGAMEEKNIHVPALLREIEAAVAPLAEKSGVSLCLSKAEDCYICGDKALLQSLFFNLIDNAMKASRRGQTVSLSCEKVGDSVRFSVCDHGIGISDKDIKKVTEPFYMANKSRSRKAGGVGLGLSLCVEIVRLHHGKMSIKSKLGEGTEIQITLKGVPPTHEKE